ncbi:MAG: hypothetical protein PQJ46_15410, partial [Spirochaetales bacterium]|nr:hypothetical protein [Spirochaetales bacterium]
YFLSRCLFVKYFDYLFFTKSLFHFSLHCIYWLKTNLLFCTVFRGEVNSTQSRNSYYTETSYSYPYDDGKNSKINSKSGLQNIGLKKPALLH